MSNETKRDVFKVVLDDWKQNFISSLPRDGSFEDWSESLSDYSARYAAALPDDLPVIPEAVSEYIQWGKSYDIQLYMMYSFKFIHSQGFKKLTDDVESWIISSSNAFARAWLLGSWRVEETGEIVKLEEEK
ncbi:hypothetical protein D2U14_01495 [Lacticaseibacillus paracasei]|uniref:hypothetical protein n=1 Tax=Lacticaseibacillus paracasei TaxID=1597 RepID=UPI000E59DCC6|nr:hypothetical protein [Lacticaseibacillus paracasei]RHX74802.1 hypothetical protein D2U14_01495 [Lacticaseibacillus paracasei]